MVITCEWNELNQTKLNHVQVSSLSSQNLPAPHWLSLKPHNVWVAQPIASSHPVILPTAPPVAHLYHQFPFFFRLAMVGLRLEQLPHQTTHFLLHSRCYGRSLRLEPIYNSRTKPPPFFFFWHSRCWYYLNLSLKTWAILVIKSRYPFPLQFLGQLSQQLESNTWHTWAK